MVIFEQKYNDKNLQISHKYKKAIAPLAPTVKAIQFLKHNENRNTKLAKSLNP